MQSEVNQKENLNDKLEWVSRTDDSLGYDIRSYNVDEIIANINKNSTKDENGTKLVRLNEVTRSVF